MMTYCYVYYDVDFELWIHFWWTGSTVSQFITNINLHYYKNVLLHLFFLIATLLWPINSLITLCISRRFNTTRLHIIANPVYIFKSDNNYIHKTCLFTITARKVQNFQFLTQSHLRFNDNVTISLLFSCVHVSILYNWWYSGTYHNITLCVHDCSSKYMYHVKISILLIYTRKSIIVCALYFYMHNHFGYYNAIAMFYAHVHELVINYDVSTSVVFHYGYRMLYISSITFIVISTYMHSILCVAHIRSINVLLNINLLMHIAICVSLSTLKQTIYAILCLRVRTVGHVYLIKHMVSYCYFSLCRMQPAPLLCMKLILNITVCLYFGTTIMLTFSAFTHVMRVLYKLKLYMYIWCIFIGALLLVYYLLIAINISPYLCNINIAYSDHSCKHNNNKNVLVTLTMNETNCMQIKQVYPFKSACPNNSILEVLSSEHIYLCTTYLHRILSYNLYYLYMLCFRLDCVHSEHRVMSNYNVLFHMYVSTHVIQVHIIIYICSNG